MGVGTYENILRPTQNPTLAGMDPLLPSYLFRSFKSCFGLKIRLQIFCLIFLSLMSGDIIGATKLIVEGELLVMLEEDYGSTEGIVDFCTEGIVELSI